MENLMIEITTPGGMIQVDAGKITEVKEDGDGLRTVHFVDGSWHVIEESRREVRAKIAEAMNDFLGL